MKFRLPVLATLVLSLLSMSLPASAKETKEISFKLRNAEPVVFSHDFHLGKYNNNCRVCHNALFNLKDRKHYTMAEMEKGKSCGACHTGMKAFSVADEADCIRCHKGKPRPVSYKVKGAGEVAFNHQSHIPRVNGKCRTCHNAKVITGKERNVTMAQMEKGTTCGACHDGKKAFTVAGNCGNCHKGLKPKEIAFKIKGVAEATFSHDFHLGMFSCKDCHTSRYPYKAGAKHFTMADMEKGKSCGGCHNGKDAFASTGDCGKCHKGLKPGVLTYKTNLGDASFSHEFHLGMFKCAECHTKIFKFKKGSSSATMAEMEGGKSCGACHNGKDAFSVKDDCGKCHKM